MYHPAPFLWIEIQKFVFYNSNTSTFNSIQVKNVYQYSDARAKKDIQPLSDGLYKVLNLNPVSYNRSRKKNY